jgi:anthranilate phosphoribosyltransferase
MNKILTTLYNYASLNETEAHDAIRMVVCGDCSESQAAAFLSVYIMRKPSIHELSGFRKAMRELCLPITLSPSTEAVDIVGTGGDGKNSFNISTLAAIVTAAAGCTVIKHGNYGVSSMNGSSNVLEYLGYRFTSDSSVLQAQLDTANICFLHAPLFHPAMKRIASVRKDLGVRSFFNLLGPLTNPAQLAVQLLGVNSLETARTYRYLMQGSNERYAIVHSLDGYDEISLTSSFKLITAQQESLLTPQQLGFDTISPAAIDGGRSIKEAADIFMDVLRAKRAGPRTNAVAANSGLAIHMAQPHIPLNDCIALAQETLLSGKAYLTFKQLLNHSYEHS